MEAVPSELLLLTHLYTWQLVELNLLAALELALCIKIFKILGSSIPCFTGPFHET